MRRTLTFEELRSIQIELLDAVHDFCLKRGLRYSLGGGTLLGAIRHSGFIPWDDDVDIMMPRPDYEVFIREFTHSNMALQNLENSDDTYIPFTKIYDTRTILIEHYATNGVFIDLFPIDGLPDEDSLGDYLKAQKSIFANLYNLHDYRTQDYLKYDKSLPQSMVKLKYWVKHLFYDSRDKSIRKLKKLYSQYSFDNSEYAGAICGAYGEKEHMQRSAFVEYMPIKFESRVYQCIASYDAYLKKHYGDYMTLPPLEKQCRTHSFEVYWKN